MLHVCDIVVISRGVQFKKSYQRAVAPKGGYLNDRCQGEIERNSFVLIFFLLVVQISGI